MTENKRFMMDNAGTLIDMRTREMYDIVEEVCPVLNALYDENEELKAELKRCKEWINSDKNDYELTLAFIKNKGYSLKDVLEYEKGLKMKNGKQNK